MGGCAERLISPNCRSPPRWTRNGFVTSKRIIFPAQFGDDIVIIVHRRVRDDHYPSGHRTPKTGVFVVMFVEISEHDIYFHADVLGFDVSVGNPQATRTNASVTSGLLSCRILGYTWFFVKKTKMIRKSHEKWLRGTYNYLYSRIGYTRRNKLLQFSRGLARGDPAIGKRVILVKPKRPHAYLHLWPESGGCFSRKISPNRQYRKTYRTTTIQQKRQWNMSRHVPIVSYILITRM